MQPRPEPRRGGEAGQGGEPAGDRGRELERDGAGPDAREGRHDEVVGPLGLVLPREVRVAEVDGGLDPAEAVERLVQEVRAEVHLVADVRDALLGPEPGVDEGREPGLVELDRVGAGGAHRLDLPAQDADAVAHELLARRVRGPRVLGMPHPAPDDVGRRQGGLDAAVRPGARVADLRRRDLAVVLDRRHDRRVGEAAARVQVGPEAADALGEDLDVALAAPLAVGDLVEPRPLLEPDGRVDGRVEEAVRLGLVEAPGLAIEDDVPDPGRPREAADDGGREEGARQGFEGRGAAAPARRESAGAGAGARYARRILKLNFRSSRAWFGFGVNSTYFWSP